MRKVLIALLIEMNLLQINLVADGEKSKQLSPANGLAGLEIIIEIVSCTDFTEGKLKFMCLSSHVDLSRVQDVQLFIDGEQFF